MIDLHRLEGFYWVAKSGGYTRAARVFPYPITQAGLHHQVRKLQDELGLVLLERVGRDRMCLTPAGRHLFAYAARVFEQRAEVETALRAHAYGGTLRIHASRQLIAHLLPGWLAALRRRRADVVPAVAELGEADPLRLLREHDTDLVVEHLPAVPPDVQARTVATIFGRVVLPADVSAERIDELAAQPFVAYAAGVPERAIQLAALASAGLSPTIAATAPDAGALVALVGAGIGYSLVPLVADVEEAAVRATGVRIIATHDQRFEYPVSAAWRRTELPHPLIEAALAALDALAPPPARRRSRRRRPRRRG